jgi:multiple sugar transport system ATP-binding protein
MAEIQFDRVTKVYKDGTEAVKALNLEVEDGALMVLVGPSGCGKTTALRMVAGLEEITEGEIRIGDLVVNDIAPKDRDIAMVFQNYALYPHMTVFENMAFGLKLRRFNKRDIQKRVQEAARILALEDMLKRRPGQLSGGQRQRVAMGRAIVREPKAFLMDEPLSNLDAKLRVQMRTEISRIQRAVGVTTIYVTHDQVEAMTMGDKVAVLKLGELQQVDTPQRLYRRPANLFVAGFIGSPAMNLVEATIELTDGKAYTKFGDHRLRIPPELLSSRPALRHYEGRRVVLGVRPEHMEDAQRERDAPEDQRISTNVDLREDMGPEVYVHFTVEAPPVLTEDTKELAVDRGEEILLELEQMADSARTPFIARFHGASTVKEGDRADVFVDTGSLQFFDLETGETITDNVRG